MSSEDNENKSHPLQRDVAVGMNPVSLLTGFYGDRGARIRHRVHEGALRLPKAALDLIDETSKTYTLPGLDSVVRPSVDPTKASYTLTEVHSEIVTTEGVNQADGTIYEQTSTKMVAKTRVITRGPDRIRGGGGEENETTAASTFEGAATPVAQAGEQASDIPSESKPTDNSSEGSTVPPAAPESTQQLSTEETEAPVSPAAAVVTTGVSPSTQTPLPSESKPTDNSSEGATVPPAAPESTQQLTTEKTEAPVPPAAALVTTGVSPSTQTSQAPAPAAQAAPASVPAQNVSASGSSTAPTLSAPPPEVTSSAPPATVSSSDAKVSEPRVISLKKRPAAQWEQHIPAATDETEMKVDVASKIPKPEWYKPDRISSLERSVLPEWFDCSASHRTPESYIQAREKLIEMSVKLGHNRFVTTTMARRSIPGDAGSLLRLHSFLTSYALINEDSINDSAPTPMCFQKKPGETLEIDDSIRDKLMHSVVELARKRPKLETPGAVAPIDWAAVATSVGHGLTPSDCERQFLALPIDDEIAREGSITPDTTATGDGEKYVAKAGLRHKILKDLVDQSEPAVISAVTKAALTSTESLAQAQKAAVVGLVASQAVAEARSEEDAVTRILAEVVDLRMKKLENRLALLDDVEGMLDAERVALELERRDLYTARCRHWFGGT